MIKEKIRVLLVDDDETAQFAATEFLKKLDCVADIVDVGAEALEILTKKTYDLIFMDLKFFGMDGFKITKEIRSLGIKTPIIVVTAYHQDGIKKHAADIGLVDYIVKPLTMAHCKSILTKYGFYK